MIKRHLAGLIVAATVAGSGVAAVAQESGGNPPPNKPPREQVQKCREEHQAGQPPSEECQQLRDRHRKPPRPAVAFARHTIHGDLIVKDKDGQFRSITLDKGTVESKSGDSVTIKREDGKSLTFKVTGDTKFRGVDSLDALQAGQPAVVLSKDATALEIAQRPPGRNNANGGNVEADEEQVPAT